MVQLRRQLAQHAHIVAGLETRHRHQHLAGHFVQGVFQFGYAVSGIDVDQNQANLGGGELHQQPLRVVVRPDTDALARLQAQPQQSAGKLMAGGLQFAVGVAQVLVGAHQRLMVVLAQGHGVKKSPQRLLDQRLIGGPAGQTGGQNGVGHGAQRVGGHVFLSRNGHRFRMQSQEQA